MTEQLKRDLAAALGREADEIGVAIDPVRMREVLEIPAEDGLRILDALKAWNASGADPIPETP